MKRLSILGLSLAFVFTLSLPANANIVLDGWDLNIGGVDGAPDDYGVVQNIQEIGFTGITHNSNPEYFDSSLPEGFGYTDGLLYALGFENTAGTSALDYDLNQAFGPDNPTGTPTVENAGWQLTFDFSVDVFNNPTGTGFDFDHIAAADGLYTDGIMEVYLDWYDGTSSGTFTAASKETGAGFQDGEKVAEFSVLGVEGGIWTGATFDGSDDARFELTWLLDGVFWLDYDNAIPLEVGYIIGITDSNIDADPDNGSSFALGDPNGTQSPLLPAQWPEFRTTPYPWDAAYTDSFAAFWTTDDGSARLAVIPEPSTFLLLGAGLLGLAYCSRKRVRK